jgi:AcrR family transcriptional regulator
MKPILPLRDRKKAKLRQALSDASLRLFLHKGYSATTLEEISAECDVTVQTLLRYFGSKEDLLFSRQAKSLENCERGLMEAVEKKSVMSYWQHFYLSSAHSVVVNPEVLNTYKIIESVPALHAKFYTIVLQYQTLLERALCMELGVEPGEDRHSLLLSYALVFGPLEEALRAIARGDGASIARRVDSIMKYALDNFKRPADPKKTSARTKNYA